MTGIIPGSVPRSPLWPQHAAPAIILGEACGIVFANWHSNPHLRLPFNSNLQGIFALVVVGSLVFVWHRQCSRFFYETI